MMAAVKIVDYEEWLRRKQGSSGLPSASPSTSGTGGDLPRLKEKPDRVLVDVSGPGPGLPLGPPRRPFTTPPDGPRPAGEERATE